jgi:hypothetical protein
MTSCPFDHKIKAKVQIGSWPNTVKVPAKEPQKGLVQWFHQVDEVTIDDFPTDPAQQPHIYIYFYEHATLSTKKRFGYVKLAPSSLSVDQNSQWCEIVADPFMKGNLGDGKVPGFVLLRAAFGCVCMKVTAVNLACSHVLTPIFVVAAVSIQTHQTAEGCAPTPACQAIHEEVSLGGPYLPGSLPLIA